MIIFLNFAPIEFMGGAEKWMLETAKEVNKKEHTIIVDVSAYIANIYGKLVLKRDFKSHSEELVRKVSPERLTLKIRSFIPYTKQWRETKNTFKKSRIVYSKFEILEILICLYFGGLNIFKKTVAGIILSPQYYSSETFFQKIHNLLYSSSLYRFFLRNSYKVHVLNKRDEIYLKTKFNLGKITYIPLGVAIPIIKSKSDIRRKKNELQIIFVGELSFRKGIDTLCEIIINSPKKFIFNIIGDGPMKKNIIGLTRTNKNYHYYGYVDNKELSKIYAKCDVIVFPSRAESFGLAMVEAASYGLRIVNSKEVSLNLPSYIEHTINERNPKKYLLELEKILVEKKNNKIQRDKIRQYTIDNFSVTVANSIFMKIILDF